MSTKIVLAGCGNMGFAMLSGWLRSARISSGETFVVEPAAELRDRAVGLGVGVYGDASELPAALGPRLVVFAVKPQSIREVAVNYRRFVPTGTTFLSVAAGIRMTVLQEILGAGAPIVRCMPNTPAAIGEGMTAMVANGNVAVGASGFIADLLSAMGKVVDVESEELMDAVTAVSGSGPAYVFHFIEALAAAAETVGLSPSTALLLAKQTVYGSAALAIRSEDHPQSLRQQVTSRGGTTAAALSVLMGEDRLKTLITEAVEAARLRSMAL